jgi:hypothetical protein
MPAARACVRGSHHQRRPLSLWQEFLDWFWGCVAWLKSDGNLVIVIGLLGLVLLYVAVGRRR